MAYKVFIFRDAELDIREAALWYKEKPHGLGKRFVISVKDQIALIKTNPLVFEIRYKNVRQR